MLKRDQFCLDCEACLGWPYVSPGTNDERGIDCSGLLVRAYRKQGASIYHGSNTIWRKHMVDKCKGKLTSVSQLEKGMAVFKWTATGDPQRDGLGNFCHIGVVTSVKPLRIVHASTDGYQVKTDTRLGKWKYYGRLAAVDYGGESAEAAVQTSLDGVTNPTLCRGSRGADVRVLQMALGGIEVDGIFGMDTFKAVQEFQRKNGLKADGIVGRLTWAALGVGG